MFAKVQVILNGVPGQRVSPFTSFSFEAQAHGSSDPGLTQAALLGWVGWQAAQAPSGALREEPYVIYEDEDLAVIFKPHGWSSQQSKDGAWALFN